MMAKIVLEAEQHMDDAMMHRRRAPRQLSISETICEAVAHAAWELEMRAIAVYTESGTTARLISKYRPPAAVYAFAKRETVCNRMNLFWGVKPLPWKHGFAPAEMITGAERALMERGKAVSGDVIGVVAGTRMHSGATNFMRLLVIGSEQAAAGGAANERRKQPRLKPAAIERRRR
jgi:pyruvate kinase